MPKVLHNKYFKISSSLQLQQKTCRNQITSYSASGSAGGGGGDFSGSFQQNPQNMQRNVTITQMKIINENKESAMEGFLYFLLQNNDKNCLSDSIARPRNGVGQYCDRIVAHYSNSINIHQTARTNNNSDSFQQYLFPRNLCLKMFDFFKSAVG